MSDVQDVIAGAVWGCVLIGGQSRRMGCPKHLLPADGRTWVEQTVSVLQSCVETVVIAGAGYLPPALVGVTRVGDVPGLGGPLAGILAAFRYSPQVSWLVTACDLPDMNQAALRWLLAYRGPGIVAVMPDLAADGRVEPLLAYYDQSCRPLLEEMAAAGHRRLNLLRQAGGVITPQPPSALRGCWRNVNSPEEFGAVNPGEGR